MNLAQNVCLDDFRSSSNFGHLVLKLGHQAKLKENLVNTLEFTFLK